MPDTLYATSSSADILLAFVIGELGALEPHPRTPFLPTGKNPQYMAVHPSKRLLYTSNHYAASLSAFSLASDGSMTELRKVSLEEGSRPVGIAFTPVGGHLFVARGPIDGLAVDLGTGDAWSLPGSPYARDQRYTQVVVHPAGSAVYASGGGALGGFGVEASAGSLLPLDGFPIPVPQPIASLTMHPSGRTLYVGAGTSIYGYGIDPSTGALTAGRPVPGPEHPIAAAFTPRGDFYYAGSARSGQVLGFRVEADGQPTPVAEGPGLPEAPLTAVVDSSGRYLYFSLPAFEGIAGFSIGHNGALKALPGSPFPLRAATAGLTVVAY